MFVIMIIISVVIMIENGPPKLSYLSDRPTLKVFIKLHETRIFLFRHKGDARGPRGYRVKGQFTLGFT